MMFDELSSLVLAEDDAVDDEDTDSDAGFMTDDMLEDDEDDSDDTDEDD